MEQAAHARAMKEVKREVKNEITHPTHYNSHPSGVECRTIAQEFSFNLGNVIKYVWRAALKDNTLINLQKAKQCIEFEIERLSK